MPNPSVHSRVVFAVACSRRSGMAVTDLGLYYSFIISSPKRTGVVPGLQR